MLKASVAGLGMTGLLRNMNALPSCEVTPIAKKESILVRFAKELLPNLKFYPNLKEMLAGEEELGAVYVITLISSTDGTRDDYESKESWSAYRETSCGKLR
ncbi:MAG: hypothetical protein QW292_03895 [Candidatus Parvarchaeota archaeon]